MEMFYFCIRINYEYYVKTVRISLYLDFFDGA